MWIKAGNGNLIEIDDDEHAKRAVADGHDVFEARPGTKGAKKWAAPEPEADEPAADGE